MIIQKKHIQAMLKMAELYWAWNINDYRYRVRHTYDETIVFNVRDISSGVEKLEVIKLGSELNDIYFEALKVGWYELYTPIEVKDANKDDPNFKRNPLHDKHEMYEIYQVVSKKLTKV